MYVRLQCMFLSISISNILLYFLLLKVLNCRYLIAFRQKCYKRVSKACIIIPPTKNLHPWLKIITELVIRYQNILQHIWYPLRKYHTYYNIHTSNINRQVSTLVTFSSHLGSIKRKSKNKM